MPFFKLKTFCFISGLALIFCTAVYAGPQPVKKSTPKQTKFVIPPVVKLPFLKVNPPVRFKNTSTQVLAGLKLPNTGIYINNKPVIAPNKYTSWYYEYPLASPHKIVISAQKIASISQLRNAVPLDLDKTKSLDEDAPRLFNYRFDPLTRDFLFDIQDPAGVLSYNIYYTNSLSSPFILAQRDVAVSGTGITTWRDNGQYTGSHPSKVTMRFYRIEINRMDTVNPIFIVSSPQEGEVVED